MTGPLRPYPLPLRLNGRRFFFSRLYITTCYKAHLCWFLPLTVEKVSQGKWLLKTRLLYKDKKHCLYMDWLFTFNINGKTNPYKRIFAHFIRVPFNMVPLVILHTQNKIIECFDILNLFFLIQKYKYF